MGVGQVLVGAGAVAGSGVAGAVYGNRRVAEGRAALDDQIQRDLQEIATTGTLTPIPPYTRIAPRTQKSILLCYLIGAAIGAVLCFVLVGAGFLMVAEAIKAQNPGYTSAQGIVGAIMFGGIAAIIGAFIPGATVIGSLLWLAETRKRLDAGVAGFVRPYWDARTQISQVLAARTIHPNDAISQLHAYHSTVLYPSGSY